ncbi:putative membrane protein [Mycobacterium xenopi 3993]|nr:putative membrane protein [Mycobacterium xenopi 3993]
MVCLTFGGCSSCALPVNLATVCSRQHWRGAVVQPERATNPLAIAGAFAVLFLPYSLLGPFAGALMDRWTAGWCWSGEHRSARVGGRGGRGLGRRGQRLDGVVWRVDRQRLRRFVSSGLSAALPHVVPRHKVVTMNSLANATGAVAAFGGANFMLLPRWLFGAGDSGSASIIFVVAIPIAIALTLSLRFAAHALGPDDSKRAVRGSVIYAVITGWLRGVRTVLDRPTVAATLSGLATHRMVFGVNTLLVLVLVRHAGAVTVAGLGTAVLFLAATGAGSFLANALTRPRCAAGIASSWPMARWPPRAVIQIAGATLQLAIMVLCGFLLGVIGQVVKLCADTAMQIDVDDALRGHVFTVQDSLFWFSFIVAVTVAALVIPDDGRSRRWSWPVRCYTLRAWACTPWLPGAG